MKYLFMINRLKINIKKYNIVPCQVFIRSNLLIINFCFSFLKVSTSLVAYFTNVFFFNTKHSSSLINMDLMKGYFGIKF